MYPISLCVSNMVPPHSLAIHCVCSEFNHLNSFFFGEGGEEVISFIFRISSRCIFVQSKLQVSAVNLRN